MNKWISIEERLPEHRQTVYVYTNKNAQIVVIFVDNVKMAEFLRESGIPIEIPNPFGYSFCSQEVSGNELHGITHWMPIMKAPE